MKIYHYAIITVDDRYIVKTYQTLQDAKWYFKRLNDEDKAKVKIIKIGK